MGPAQANLLQGAPDLPIPKALPPGGSRGPGVSRRIGQVTGGAFPAEPGSLFPAPRRAGRSGRLVSARGESENNRRAEFYRRSRAGRRQLRDEARGWRRIAFAVAQAVEAV